MKYIVYLTTNIVNNKIYVGVHQTETPDIFDGYLGCGLDRSSLTTYIKHPKTPFHYAVKKYGYDAFKRSTIKVFSTVKEALKLEEQIVNVEFIKRQDTYNVVVGGGLPPNLSKITYQYSLDGKYLNTWPSITEVGAIYNISPNSIGEAVKYKRACNKFFWSFEKFETLDISEYTIHNPEVIVYVYDSNKNYVRSYNSYTECCKALNDSSIAHLQRAAKLGNKVQGFYISLIKSDKFPEINLPRLSGEVHQYNLNGEYIQSFKSIKEAENQLNLGKLTGINTSIKMGEQYKGFLWRRGEKQDSIKPYKTPKCAAKRIAQYTMDGKFVKEYRTISEAKKEFPNVGKVLRGQASHCHNYIFKYIE